VWEGAPAGCVSVGGTGDREAELRAGGGVRGAQASSLQPPDLEKELVFFLGNGEGIG